MNNIAQHPFSTAINLSLCFEKGGYIKGISRGKTGNSKLKKQRKDKQPSKHYTN